MHDVIKFSHVALKSLDRGNKVFDITCVEAILSSKDGSYLPSFKLRGDSTTRVCFSLYQQSSADETYIEWKTGRTRNAVSTAFRVLPNFHKCFYNLIETRSTCFQFLLENTATRKRKTTCYLWLSKCKFSLLTPSLRQQLMLVLCLHCIIETIFNQSARIKTVS